MTAHLHFRTPLLRTPFHPRAAEANVLNAWAPWGGYTVPVAYSEEAAEYTALRNSCGVVDLTPMVKYDIAGPDAEAFLDRLTVRNVAKLKPGRVHYTCWCDDDGKVLDDGTVFRFAADRFRLCCQERHLPWLLDTAFGLDVTIRDVTADVAALAVQGPGAFDVLDRAGLGGLEVLRPFDLVELGTRRFGPVAVSRTGFTGDLGYEVWARPDKALALWDAILGQGRSRVRPVGTAALDMARIEAGFLVTNLDFVAGEQALRDDRRRSPFELGLAWMVDFDKGHFVGRRALVAERDRGSSRFATVGLEIDGNVPAAHAVVYHARKREVGIVTAGIWSPSAKRNIAIASLERPWDERGELWVEIYALRELRYHKLMVRARVARRPFFDPPRRRATPPGRV